jgi:hypothetical protein
MKNLFVIVHEEATKEDRIVRREILRIKREEEFVLVEGNPTKIMYDIPEGYQLLVCGAYHGNQNWDSRCIDEHMKSLRRKKLFPELYLPGTISLDP